MTNSKTETTDERPPAFTVYEIQTHTLADGWVNTWTYEDSDGDTRPETFSSKEAAQAALEEYLQELAEDAVLGNISHYDRAEFRVHAVPTLATGGVA
ncbi:MAG: hypothetical protein HY423_08410 [Candidatus Lambdaproteobacteria bacterium]|nr:hypothetical protein [Candidatus Lambdaproteobacteria bacterium]